MIKEIETNESKNLDSNKKENIFLFFLDTLTFISLSIVIFGIFSLGFFAAPIIFSHLTPRAVASEVMTAIFFKYYPFAFICSFIAVMSESIRVFLSRNFQNHKLAFLKFACILSVFIMTGYTNNKILPEINNMRIEQNSPTLWTNPVFVNLHNQSEKFGKASFTIGLIPLIIMIFNKRK